MLKKRGVIVSTSHADGIGKGTSIEDFKNKKKSVGGFEYSSCNLKRVAQMPEKDRREILKIIESIFYTSLSFVNKDWEHWVTLQGGVEAAMNDVHGIGSLIGVKYKGDAQNSFNVLPKEGRRDLEAAVGRILSKGESGGKGVSC